MWSGPHKDVHEAVLCRCLAPSYFVFIKKTKSAIVRFEALKKKNLARWTFCTKNRQIATLKEKKPLLDYLLDPLFLLQNYRKAALPFSSL